jgi:polygalacturonase
LYRYCYRYCDEMILFVFQIHLTFVHSSNQYAFGERINTMIEQCNMITMRFDSRRHSFLRTVFLQVLFGLFCVSTFGQSSASCHVGLSPRAVGTDTTAAIQEAIDRCATGGGGTVEIPAGSYQIKPIALKSKVNLHLDPGAVLHGVTDESAYPVTMQNIWQGKPQDRPLALIGAAGQKNVSLTGPGTVDGEGAGWWKHYDDLRKKTGEELARPWLVQFTHCTHVVVDGVELRDSPSYTLVPFLSDDVTIRNVRIVAPPDSPNTDGIVPYSSHHVRVTGATVDSGDDNVAIKSSRPIGSGGGDFSAFDITISDCTFLHGHGATIGADTGGGVHDVLMENITFRGTTNGIRIKSGREISGEVARITYRHLAMTDTSPAVSILEYYPRTPDEDTAQPVDDSTPRFHDIHIIDLSASGGKDAGSVIGLPESPVKGVFFENVKISAGVGMKVRNASVSLGRGTLIKAARGEDVIRQNGAELVHSQ